MNNYFIYCLIDPIDGMVKYIGRSNNPRKRYFKHLYVKRKGKLNKKESWIRSLDNKKLKPILNILDEVLFSEKEFWESHYIWLYYSWGFPLLNADFGDFDGRRWNEDIRIKMGKNSLGKTWKLSDITKKKMSESAKSRDKDYYIRLNSTRPKNPSIETKKKMSDSAKIRPKRIISDRTKNKMSLSAKNRIEKIKLKNPNPPKPVNQFDLNGNLIKIWGSASEAADNLGFNRSMICSCCNGSIKTAHKYIWKY